MASTFVVVTLPGTMRTKFDPNWLAQSSVSARLTSSAVPVFSTVNEYATSKLPNWPLDAAAIAPVDFVTWMSGKRSAVGSSGSLSPSVSMSVVLVGSSETSLIVLLAKSVPETVALFSKDPLTNAVGSASGSSSTVTSTTKLCPLASQPVPSSMFSVAPPAYVAFGPGSVDALMSVTLTLPATTPTKFPPSCVAQGSTSERLPKSAVPVLETTNV